ncbi:acetyl-coenzyme A transporter 1-domain-containing protein [Chytridium lagenaria]|nr:acetyl-coenzyme A transporter 1-domain-containing protein [Chytridium lagenaria]
MAGRKSATQSPNAPFIKKRSNVAEEVPLMKLASSASIQLEKEEGKGHGKKATMKDDFGNMVLLVFLCEFLLGSLLDLPLGSIPFLLKSKLSFSDIALFSLSSYPYSLKLLWSPIVDSIYIPSIGRRKSWIVPIQAIAGLLLISLGSTMDDFLARDVVPVNLLAGLFTLLVFLCATQDIAVDGWALTLLHDDNKAYASTCQTIGLNSGYFLSFTVFLAMNSAEFCNKYLRSVPLEEGMLGLGSYLRFWGVMFLIEDENSEEETSSVSVVYKHIVQVCLMPHMKMFILVLLIAKIGFQANESVTGLKLLEKGFHKEDLALAVLIDFPFQILFGYYAAKWSSGAKPLVPWLFAFCGRLVFAFLSIFIISNVPTAGITTSFFVLVMACTVLSSFMSTVQFVGLGSFFTKISDPRIGGTYMTLLNTISNLGGTWPKFFVLHAVDYFTDSACTIPNPDQSPLKCLDEHSKTLCKNLAGVCETRVDGYYPVSVGWFIYPQMKKIEGLPESAWKLPKEEEGVPLRNKKEDY